MPFDVYLLLIDFVDYLSQIKNIELYLFGSYSKLVYHEKSDVDMAIISPKAIDKSLIYKLIQKLERTYGKKVEIHEFERSSFYKNKKENKKDPLVKDILRNGIRLI